MHLPSQRKLPTDAKDKAIKWLEMKANKKMVQQQLTRETGKIVLLKDLNNILTCANKDKTSNDISRCVSILTDTYGKKLPYVFCVKLDALNLMIAI